MKPDIGYHLVDTSVHPILPNGRRDSWPRRRQSLTEHLLVVVERVFRPKTCPLELGNVLSPTSHRRLF